MAANPTSVGKMKKEELIFELHKLDVDLNPKWTVEELRSLLREQREAWGQAEKTTSLSTKNLTQLIDIAKHLGMRMPAKPTRGLLMRMIRDMDGSEISDQTVVTFGRYQGFVFEDVPTSYTDWAIREMETSDNADPQLTQMANWAAARKEEKAHTNQTGKQPRDMYGDEISDQTVVTFGRYQGCVFKDVPTSYTDWAIRETEASDIAEPQLTQMANWATARKAGKAYTSQTGKQPLDPAGAAKIKPPPMDVECVPAAPPKSTARAAEKPAIATSSSIAGSTASFQAVHQTGAKGRRG